MESLIMLIMRKLTNVLLLVYLIIGIAVINGCGKDPVVPTLTTTIISEITLNTAISGGKITNDGGGTITARGVCWGTSQSPTTKNSITTNGTGTGTFVSNLAGLLPGTTYYVRAYATNSAGTAYGNQVTFTATPVVIPTLTTVVISEITLTTAKSGGNISSDGGGAITARGICWATTQNPLITNNVNVTTNETGTGIFVSILTGLLPGTTYYIRAYATNSAGTAYGNQVTLNTTAIVFPTLTTTEVSDVTLTSAKSGGNISSDGGGAITARGICWNTSENPLITNYIATDAETGTGSFVSNLTGLTSGTTYYIRAYATNSAGTAYGNQVSFMTTPVAVPTLTTAAASAITLTTATSGGTISSDGGGAITARGVCWNTSENPLITDNIATDAATGTGSFVSNLTGLTAGTTYYIRAYATNSAGTAYGNQETFITLPVVEPTLTTTAVSAITNSTATSGGTISDDGGGAITARGICWNTSENPLLTDNIATDAATGTGSFVSNLTGLTAGTTYYIRAYATNRVGTAYGNQLSFITPVQVTDIEGNVYKTVAIGTQIWMAENLKTTKFNTTPPTDIPNVTDALTWKDLTTPAYSWYGNTIANKDIYGAMYNWFTVATGNLCPAGWHEPTDADFNTLEVYLGIPLVNVNDWGWRGTDQGTRLKSTTGWDAGGNGTNTSGFTALPGGYRHYGTSNFWGLGGNTFFWSATTDNLSIDAPNVAWYRQLDSAEPRINKMTTFKTAGKYVRCVKDN